MKASVLSAVLALAPGALAGHRFSKPGGSKCRPGKSYDIKYTTVTGFFLQDEPSTDPSTFDYTQSNFGLINRTYPTDGSDGNPQGTQWQRFAKYVDSLNSQASNTVTYKVIFFGRHGEGWHNAAESFYGTPAWNCYYGELDGNATATWADAHLTDAGVAQALKANAYYARLFKEEGLPLFETYYSSPLSRCIQTANTTFATIDLPPTHAFKPVIKELFRESISVHTCDRRMNKTDIHKFAPDFQFEEGFSEKDLLWRGKEDEGETSAHQKARSQVVLGDVFEHDDSTWISVTSHSGEIGSMLMVLSHQPFPLNTGAIIPVLVKAEYVEKQAATAATSSAASFTHEALCTAPPVTSITSQGCVCSATATATPTASSSMA